MTRILFKDISDELGLLADDPESRLITSGVSWEQYEKLLNKLGDRSGYRVSYLAGVLEIMSPSRRHEFNKKLMAMLLECYFLEEGIDFYPLGSTTFREQKIAKGIEPDESYCFGSEKLIPDLAIEVVITSGGINSLEIYQGLQLPEVWFWENHQFSLYSLRENGYEQIDQSELLPNLDLSLLAHYMMKPGKPRDLVLEFRQKLRESLEK